MDCIYASIARHSCGTSGSAEQGVSKTRSLFFGPDESLGEGVGEGVGEGACEALELGCDVGVGSTEGIGVGVGVGVEVGVAAEGVSFFTNTPLFQTNFPDFFTQVYW
jgi:hypothetical protein